MPGSIARSPSSRALHVDVQLRELRGDAVDVVGVVGAKRQLHQPADGRLDQAQLLASVGRCEDARRALGEVEVAVELARLLNVRDANRDRAHLCSGMATSCRGWGLVCRTVLGKNRAGSGRSGGRAPLRSRRFRAECATLRQSAASVCFSSAVRPAVTCTFQFVPVALHAVRSARRLRPSARR